MVSLSKVTSQLLGSSLVALAGCAHWHDRDAAQAPQTFYTVTAELALARGEPRVAALQYAAVAETQTDSGLLQRATEVTTQTLQPALGASVARRWLRVQPGSKDAQLAAARAALSLYRIEDAARYYRAVVQGAADGVDAALIELQGDLDDGDNIFGARQVADRLAAYFPDSIAALRLQGLAALRADDPHAAVPALSRVAAANSAQATNQEQGKAQAVVDDHALYQTLLRARIMAGDVEQPLAQARAALAADPAPANRFDYAILLLSAQRETEALRQLQSLTGSGTLQTAALRLVGLLQFQHGQFDQAAATFRALLETGRSADEANYYLALIADHNEDVEAALRLYALVEKGDNVLPALLRAAVLLHAHGAAGAADELFDRLIEDEPQRAPEIISARARMYADRGQFDPADALLEGALQQYPDSVELRYALASTYEDAGRVADAVHELAAVLEARPGDPAALNALGFTLADHFEKLHKARRLIERAHAAAPRNAAILDSMGWVRFRQGRDEEAVDYLRAAYADDHSGDIAAHLGEVLWQLGKRDEAVRIWSDAGAVDVENKLLKNTRRRLQAAN